ncbi:MAG: hypothetical protein ABIQ18_21225 [Umezawaea sp.]
MPVRPPLPIISAGAIAVLAGLALGIGLGGSADHPQGGGGAADPSRGPDRRQSGGDLPPMDFEGKVLSTSSRTSKASTPSTPSTTGAASVPVAASEPERTEEVTSAVGVTPTPELPPLPSVPDVSTSSLVEAPSSSTSASA